uniref:Sialidase domain-containing protein n=1 Tax=Calcidiscus leptoporus TaxID=127549 RepID=A0A7S0P3D7_9EUKA|mmetsp:Transcript_56749/g.130300  ORF Transcript_56749/g.130300 Transcript_56749/m.130300 type:complete len:416 (+) Transcript_56749:112-1359(+)
MLAAAPRNGIIPCNCSFIHAGARLFDFGLPVLIGEGEPGEHYWFPEHGAVLPKHPQWQHPAIVASARYVPDGGPPRPGTRHKFESKVSFDGGENFSHLWFDRVVLGTGTEQLADGSLVFPGVGCERTPDNRSFVCENVRYFGCDDSGTATICSNVSATGVPYSGFPFDVARFVSYEQESKVVSIPDVSRATRLLVQLRTFWRSLESESSTLGAFGSNDGGASWRFLAVVAEGSSARLIVSEAQPEPSENDACLLADGRLLAIWRVEACAPYHKSYSADNGTTWTAPVALPFGSARPKLLRLPDGRVVVSGGRPGLFLWIGDSDAEVWTAVNVASIHNGLVAAWRLPASWQYSAEFVNSSSRGAYLMESTCYTSLLAIGNGTMVLFYDRLGNGWKEPPGPWGDRDRTFSLRFRISD